MTSCITSLGSSSGNSECLNQNCWKLLKYFNQATTIGCCQESDKSSYKVKERRERKERGYKTSVSWVQPPPPAADQVSNMTNGRNQLGGEVVMRWPPETLAALKSKSQEWRESVPAASSGPHPPLPRWGKQMVMMMEEELSCDLTTAFDNRLPRSGSEALLEERVSFLTNTLHCPSSSGFHCVLLYLRAALRVDAWRWSVRGGGGFTSTADDGQEVLLLHQVLYSVIEAIGRINVGFVRLCKAWIRFSLQSNVSALVETNRAGKCPNIWLKISCFT